jgi:uncharacterized protein YqeY
MSLKEKILNDLVLALKSRDADTVAVLKLLKNSIQGKEKKLSKELDEDELNKVLLSDSKKRKDSIEQFKKGGREDLVDKETKELKIIQKYLPEMKSKDEIKGIVCDIIKEESIEKSVSNFGQVMKLTMQRLNGQAEGNVVSEVVKEQLA